MAFLKQLWRYRALVLGLVRRELRVRSARAAWGTAWLFVQPAFQIAIYTLVFSRVLQAKLPGSQDTVSYSIYLCAGMLPWTLFAEQVGRGQNLFLEHAHMLKTTAFPRSTLPIALLVSTALNFALLMLPFAIFLLGTGRWPGWIVLTALPLLALQVLLGLALAVSLGTLNVFFRDIGHVVPMALQFLFWLTPIVYPLAIVPEAFHGAIGWNPLLPLVTGYQRLVLEGVPPVWSSLVPVAVLAIAIGIGAWALFRRLSADLVDEL